MEKQTKNKYQAPSIEVIPMEIENVIAGSLGDGGSNSPTETRSLGGTRSYGSASTSDLEDLINDILTVEQ